MNQRAFSLGAVDPEWRAKAWGRLLEGASVEPNTGCWLWTRDATEGGYGRIPVRLPGWTRRKVVMAHRLAYELEVGPIPRGLLACHRCDQSFCINPRHLFLGTNRQNIDDMVRKGRSAKGCRNGAYTKPESRVRGSRNGRAILTEWLVYEMRVRALRERPVDIARSLGLRKGLVLNAVRGKRWAHVPFPEREAK